MDTPSRHLHTIAPSIFTVDICIRHGDDVLMFARSKTKKMFPGCLALPGGHIDEGENPLTAAIREAREEVGISLTPKRVQLKFVALHYHQDRRELFVVFGFLARIYKKPERILSNDEGSASWMSKDTLMSHDAVFPPVKYYLSHVLENTSGIMYNYSIWNNSQLVRVISEEIDTNS